jgi:hypothetical protein
LAADEEWFRAYLPSLEGRRTITAV